MVRILGLGGSLRDGSTSLAALRYALDVAEGGGAETRLLDLNELRLPLYIPNYKTPADYGPEAAAAIGRLLDGLRWADGMFWSCPSYHGAVSGAMKNALDYAQFFSRDEPSFLYGKVVGAIGTGGGTIGAVNVVAQLVQIAHALRAQAVPLLVPITGAYKAFDGGELTDPQFRQRLDALGKELVALAGVEAARRAVV